MDEPKKYPLPKFHYPARRSSLGPRQSPKAAEKAYEPRQSPPAIPQPPKAGLPADGATVRQETGK
jgi:hypothetical protein